MINGLIKEFDKSVFFFYQDGSFCSRIEFISRADGQSHIEYDICICVTNELILCIISHWFPVKHDIHSRVFEMIKFRQLWLHVNGKVTPLNLWVLNLNMAIKRVGFVWKIISRLVWFQNLIRKMSKRQRSTYHWGYNEWSGYKYSCYFISLLSHLNRCQQNSTTFHYHMFWEVMYCHPSIL